MNSSQYEKFSKPTLSLILNLTLIKTNNMIKNEISPEDIKKATTKFAEALNSVKRNLNSIDIVLEVFEFIDKKITPYYEKMKKISDICDKVVLIDNTIARLNKINKLYQRFGILPILGIL